MKFPALAIIVLALSNPAAAKQEQNNEAPGLPELIYRSNGVYSLLEAAAANDTETLSRRIKEGANVNQLDEEGNSALHLAAEANATKCITQLLKAGADAMQKNAAGKTASELATAPRSLKVLKRAMTRRLQEIELCEKIASGDNDALQAAIKQKGFNPNMLNATNSMPVLAMVCEQGNVQIAKALIAAGADVNFASPDSRSILHKAIHSDNAELIKVLLKAGANPVAQSSNRATPLHDAVWSRRLQSIKALLPAYKSINYSPDGAHNGIPIGLAINRGFSDAVKLFIEAGIDLNGQFPGDPPLMIAAQAGRKEIIEMLLKAGADKNKSNKQGKTARDVAATAVRHLF